MAQEANLTNMICKQYGIDLASLPCTRVRT